MTNTEVTGDRHCLAQHCQPLSDITLADTVAEECVTALAQYRQLLSGVPLTDTVVTEESGTASAQFCQLLFDVTVTDKKVTEESATAWIWTLAVLRGWTVAPGMGRRRRSPGRSRRRARTRAARPWAQCVIHCPTSP